MKNPMIGRSDDWTLNKKATQRWLFYYLVSDTLSANPKSCVVVG